MTIEEALDIIEKLVQPQILSNVQQLVFRQCWEGRTYAEIAASNNYDTDYIKYVGSQLWQLLSQVLGKKVTKSNICSVLRYKTLDISPDKNIDCITLESETFSTPINTVTAKAAILERHLGWAEAVDVPVFYGRDAQLRTLKQWVVDDRCRLVTTLGMGGIGKTALAVKLAEQIENEFEYLIWRSLRNAPSIDDLLAELIQLLSKGQETQLPKSLDAKLSRLIHYLRSSRCLLVLDNVESILQSEDYCGRYCEGYEGYGQLLRLVGETLHQSCILLTSREMPIGLRLKEGKNIPVRSLKLTGLAEVDAHKILQFNGICGWREEMRSLSDFYLGNPLALKIVAQTIQNLFNSNIAEFLSEKTFIFSEIRDLLDQQYNRLTDIEKQILYWIVINRQPISLYQLQEIMSLAEKATLLEALVFLERRSLIENKAAYFSVSSILTEYITTLSVEVETVPANKVLLFPSAI